MYHITTIEIINGNKTTLENVKGGFFPNLIQVNDYQNVMVQYFNNGSKHKLTVYVNYKVLKQNHVKWM